MHRVIYRNKKLQSYLYYCIYAFICSNKRKWTALKKSDCNKMFSEFKSRATVWCYNITYFLNIIRVCTESPHPQQTNYWERYLDFFSLTCTLLMDLKKICKHVWMNFEQIWRFYCWPNNIYMWHQLMEKFQRNWNIMVVTRCQFVPVFNRYYRRNTRPISTGLRTSFKKTKRLLYSQQEVWLKKEQNEQSFTTFKDRNNY